MGELAGSPHLFPLTRSVIMVHGCPMYPPSLASAASHLLEEAAIRGLMISTAESCTGGLIGGLLTDVPGSSIVVERGFIVYSNASKNELLGVPIPTITQFGAVSREVCIAMAQGAIERSQADISVAVTGIAGPTGGTAEKPVGLVHIAVAGPGGRILHKERRYGEIGRQAVRMRTVEDGIELLRTMVRGQPAQDMAS